MARYNFSLICAPNAIARVLRVFPKLALLFLIVHVGLMIYAVLNSTSPVKKSTKKEHVHIDQSKEERIFPHAINDSLINIKLNKSEQVKNGTMKRGHIVRGRLAPKLFNRGHQDVR